MEKQKVYQETQNETPILHQEQEQGASSKNSIEHSRTLQDKNISCWSKQWIVQIVQYLTYKNIIQTGTRSWNSEQGIRTKINKGKFAPT